MLSEDDIYSPVFLDRLRSVLHAWSCDLFEPAVGGFRKNDEIGVTVMASTDMAWIRYATNDPEFGAPDGEKWREYVEGLQCPETGEIRHTPDRKNWHHDAHAFWQTTGALNILGGRLRYFPEYLREQSTPDGLATWFDSFDWSTVHSSNHHQVLGLVPFLASFEDAAWRRIFFSKIREQQDPETGGWPKNGPCMSRTFAYTALHQAVGMLPPYPDKIVDVALSLQHPDGFWDRDPLPHAHTMDGAYVLARIARQIGHRVNDANAALERLLDAMLKCFSERLHELLADPHRMNCIVHTLAILQEAFPSELPSKPAYRFGLDDPKLFVCDVIREVSLQ